MKQKEFEIMNSTIFVKRNKFRYNKIGDDMKSIAKERHSIYEIQKSKFITTLFRIDSLEDVKQYLKEVKEEYPDATHHCYAYILDGKERCSDDGEPSGTAGIPILNVLKQQNLDHILCVVTRYFGGIKLGASGLVRAYSKSVSEALENCLIVALDPGYEMTITFPYSVIKNVDFLLKNYEIQSKDFQKDVTYQFSISKKEYPILLEKLGHYIKANTILNDIWVQKK